MPLATDDYVKIIVQLSDVSDRSEVTMLTGTKRYTVSRSVRVFGGEEPICITPKPGTVFLQCGTDINVHPDTKEVIWYISIDELQDALVANND